MPYADPERRAEARRKSREKYRDDPEYRRRAREQQKVYYQENREQVLTRAAERYKADPTTRKASAKAAADRLKAEMIEAYGGACACCGETEPAFLCLDHAEGDGAGKRHRALYGDNNTGVIRALRREGWPQDGRYRLLCANCNTATSWGRVCPHQRRAMELIVSA